MRRVSFTILFLVACSHETEEPAPPAPPPADPTASAPAPPESPDPASPTAPAPADDAPPAAKTTPTFIAVGYGGRRVSSRDGKTWANDVEDAPDGNDDPNLLRGVHCAQGVCVACGGGAEGGRFLVTRDGKKWDSYPTGTAGISEVAFGNGLWVAPGFTSKDAKTWVRHDVPGNGILRAIAYGGGAFVAVGDGGRRIRTTDGVTWTDEARGGTDLQTVAWGNGRFVAVGYGGRRLVSTDGKTWTNDVGDASLGPIEGVVWDGMRFLVAAPSGWVLTSTDGAAWTKTRTDELPTGRIAYGRGTYVGLSWKNTRRTSTDGVHWTVVKDDGEGANAFAAIAYGELTAP